MTNPANTKSTGRILVVDDNVDNLDVLSRRLSRRGYSVTKAEDGEAALAQVIDQFGAFDVVLLDVMMPGIDGFEVLRRLRVEFSPTELPVILVTAKDHSEDITRGLRIGANDYVTKPVDYPVLFARVRNNVELAKSHRAFRSAQKLLIDAAKMESIGYLAAGVAHEVRNPLAQLQMGVDFVKSRAGSDETMGVIVETMEEAIISADKIITNLMQFSESRRLERERADLSELITTCLSLLQDECESHNIEVLSDTENVCPAEIDVSQIETAVLNVLHNAIQAMPEGGTLRVSTMIRPLEAEEALIDEGARTGNEIRPGDEVAVLEIVDTGSGIPEEKLSTIFDAFYTSQATGKGTGLGLTVAKKIVDLHGGMLHVTNRSDTTGVRVTFILPSRPGIETSV